ncbi:MAG TPA: MBL fold metallo-hydrolase, partial [Ktedonobacteraceae bacterium]|nr:MBL fold metallo-hydrolase [Ktedonobacteraceae bacterium]
VQEAGASLLLHRLDVPPAPLSSEERRERLVGMENWLQTNGMPPEEGEVLLRDMSRMPSRVPAYRPDVLLEGGEVLEWSPFHFEVLWTPGHAAGLVCLYERQFQVLLSSDHILERISPNIGLYAQQSGDPLGEYLRSLQLVRDLPVKLVLPGHGSPFSDLSGRVDKLEAHHEQRLREMVNTLGDGEQTAYRIASRLSWRGSNQGWQQLRSFDRLAALSETLAHLHYLARQGQVTQQERDGEIVYR